jgi:glycosyltransferase involved in cell wall biosynthesis
LIPMHEQQCVVSILLPSLNEVQGIKHTINSIPYEELNNLGYTVEVIVVDGHSTDGTQQVARELGAKVILESREGYGRAYKTAFSVAIGDPLITLDADGTYPTHLIPEYIQEIYQRELDFITVNRFSNLNRGSMSLLHLLGNKILSFTLKSIYSLSIADSQSGMWILRRGFIDKINLFSDGMSLSEEIKIIAFKFFRSVEADGEYKKRIGDAKLNSIGHGWHNFKYLFKFRRMLKSAIKQPVGVVKPMIEDKTISKD